MTTRKLVTTMGTTRDLSVPDVPTVDLAILQAELPALEELVRDVGGSIRLRDLVIIKVPTGGVTEFDISGADGEAQTTPTLTGVIIHTQLHRVFWGPDEDREPGQPPACKSPDAITGIGTPGGACCRCPQQFKGCYRRMYILFLAPGDFLPKMIDAPPSSRLQVEDYTTRLRTKGIVRSGVLTEFGLEKAVNPQRNVYSRLTLKSVGFLTPTQRAELRQRLALFTFTAEEASPTTAEATAASTEVPPPTDADAPPETDVEAEES
jgi:hypothetical protein